MMLRVPAETLMPPPRPELLPVSNNVPGPVLVNPCAPASGIASVVVRLALLTETVGPPAALVLIVSALPPLTLQLKLFVGLSNTSEPIVRALSRLTVMSPVKPAVAKVAVLLAPSAVMPDCQLPASLQL